MSAPFRIRRPDTGRKGVARKPEEDFKFYLDRLMRMIPGDAVGLYLVGSGLVPEGQRVGLAIWTVVCLIGAILIRVYGTTDPERNKPPDWVHVGISSVAFVIWVYTLGGAFAAFDLHVPWIGSLLVLAWTFFVPIIYKGPVD